MNLPACLKGCTCEREAFSSCKGHLEYNAMQQHKSLMSMGNIRQMMPPNKVMQGEISCLIGNSLLSS